LAGRPGARATKKFPSRSNGPEAGGTRNLFFDIFVS